MVPKPALPPSAMRDLKLVLAVSSSYYAKILPPYRRSLEHRRFRCGKVKNPKGLQIKIYSAWHTAVTSVPPRIPVSPQSNIYSLKRPVSPVGSTVGPSRKKLKLRRLTDATAIDSRLLNLVPLLKRLRDSLAMPSHIVLRSGRWFLIRRRGPMKFDKPPELPDDLVTIKVPPGRRMSRYPSEI